MFVSQGGYVMETEQFLDVFFEGFFEGLKLFLSTLFSNPITVLIFILFIVYRWGVNFRINSTFLQAKPAKEVWDFTN